MVILYLHFITSSFFSWVPPAQSHKGSPDCIMSKSKYNQYFPWSSRTVSINLIPSGPYPKYCALSYPFISRKSVFSRDTPSYVSSSRSPQKGCCSPAFWAAACCSPTSAQGSAAQGRVSTRWPPLSIDPGTLPHCWPRKIFPSCVPLFSLPNTGFPFSPPPVRGHRPASGLGWPLPATPARPCRLFLTRGGSSPQGAPVRRPPFFRRLRRFQSRVPGPTESQAETEHVLGGHCTFDDLRKVPELSMTQRGSLRGYEAAARRSRDWWSTARCSRLWGSTWPHPAKIGLIGVW